MNAQSNPTRKKFFTVEEANAMLPLMRSILRDVTALAQELQQRQTTLIKLQESAVSTREHQVKVQGLIEEFERSQDRMQEYEHELQNLNVELKDYFTGLIDFPCWMNDRVVYLCWKLGEPEVGFWHELDAGFTGRQKLPRKSKS